MNDSDIFNEYAKLAIAQGLVSVGEEDEEKPAKKKYDKLSDDAVRLLYGIEPESIYDDKTLLEDAHPDTYSVGRSYDAMNSVVETLQQRQDMMLYIANKTPDGLATHRRYIKAHTDLKNSLIRAGFMLDNSNEMELMSFADGCTARLVKEGSKKFEKKAEIATSTILIAVGVVAAVGAIAYLWNGATSATNVKNNADQVLQALQPVMDKEYAKNIEKDIVSLIAAADKFVANKSKVAGIVSQKGGLTPAQKTDMNKITEDLKAYAKILDTVQARIGNKEPPSGWIAAIKLEASSEERSDLWAKVTDFTRSFIWTDDAKLIEKLTGEGNWLSSGTSGGLKDAIAKDKAVINATVQAMDRKMNGQPEPVPAPATPAPGAKPSAPAAPTPTPAPQS